MMIQRMLLVIVLVACVSWWRAAWADEIHVSPQGKSGAAGTKDAPLATVQEGLDRAQPGDTVQLADGVYRERVKFKNGGMFGKPVVLCGGRGAVIDASLPLTLAWRLAPELGEHVYRAAVPGEIVTLTSGGKIVTILDEEKIDPKKIDKRMEAVRLKGIDRSASSPESKLSHEWEWENIFRNGIGTHGWEGVKALTMYRRVPGELLLRYVDGLDPMTQDITVSTREPAVAITGVNRCVVRGITIRNVWFGVYLSDTVGSVVEDCRIERTDYGVTLDPGSRQCTVRFNEITHDPYSGSSPYVKGEWDYWQAVKLGGFGDRIGIDIRKTAGYHQIHDNYIHEHWGGIEDLGGLGENQGLEVHHNRIDTISDDGLEPSAAEEDGRWHHNVVTNSRCGFRIKHIKKGPLYAYGNLFWGNKEDFRVYGGRELEPARFYAYHNTSTASAALMYNKVYGIGTPGYHFYNNLFVCKKWFGNSGKSVEPNWKGDGNAYVFQGGTGEEALEWKKGADYLNGLGIDTNSFRQDEPVAVFADLGAMDLSLLPGAVVAGKGMDLEKAVPEALPGWEEYRKAQPDAGALPAGTPMLRVPRTRESVNAPEAGQWPDAEAEEAYRAETAEQERQELEANRYDGTDGASFLHADLAPLCNMGFADEVSGDGQGGAFDQGNNDLSPMKPGEQSFCGVPFRIIDPAQNGGKSMVVLRGTRSPVFPEAALGASLSGKAKYLYFLHTSAWSSDGYFMYIVHYENGERERIWVRLKQEVADWWSPASSAAKNARLGWRGRNAVSTIGAYVYRWENPHPELAIARIDMTAAPDPKHRGLTPGILAITAQRAE